MTKQIAKAVIQGEICGMLQDMASGVDERGFTKGFVETVPDYFKPEDLRQACNELAEEFRGPMTNQGVASKERVRREHEKALADAKRLANAIRILPTEVELENWTGYAVRAAVRLCRKEAKIDD